MLVTMHEVQFLSAVMMVKACHSSMQLFIATEQCAAMCCLMVPQ
jgi:hypothetical protein